MYAHDAYGSVTLLALLMFLWGAIALFTIHAPVFNVPSTLEAVMGGAALLYLLRTQHRPSTGVALVFSSVFLAYSLILVPWISVVWCALGRPQEGFIVPEVLTVVTALVIPRFVWLGAIALGLFAAESLFAYFHARRLAPALVPITEPGTALQFVLVGVALLVLREGRRRLAFRHIRLQAETTALRGIGPMFAPVRQELDTQLALLAGERTRLGSQASSPRIDRALARLGAVSRKLDSLLGGEPAFEAAEATSLPFDESRPVPSQAERLLLARDACSGATVVAAMTLMGALLWLLIQPGELRRRSLPGIVPTILVSAALLFHLVRTRRYPSERSARWGIFILFAVSLTGLSMDQLQLLRMHRPYQPLLGHKLIMVLLGLVGWGKSWLGIVLIVATAAAAIALYFGLQLGAHKDIISLTEPWLTLVFMAIGIAANAMHDQRLVASVRLLRDETAMSALRRRARMFLALRDQLNSPLQTLVLWAHQLDGQRAPQDLARVHTGIERLVCRSRELAGLDHLIPGEAHLESLNAERELRRQQ